MRTKQVGRAFDPCSQPRYSMSYIVRMLDYSNASNGKCVLGASEQVVDSRCALLRLMEMMASDQERASFRSKTKNFRQDRNR